MNLGRVRYYFGKHTAVLSLFNLNHKIKKKKRDKSCKLRIILMAVEKGNNWPISKLSYDLTMI